MNHYYENHDSDRHNHHAEQYPELRFGWWIVALAIGMVMWWGLIKLGYTLINHTIAH